MMKNHMIQDKQLNDDSKVDAHFSRILIPMFSFVKSGGMRVISRLANEWATQGHNVTIVVLNSEKPYFPIKSNVEVIYQKANSKWEKITTLVGYIKDNLEQYDVVIATFYLTCYPIWIASLLKHDLSKNIYYIQAYEPEFDMYNGSKLHKRLAEITYGLPFKRIVNSKIYFDYKKLKAERFCPPGLDLKQYYPKNISLFSSRVKIGTIGRTEEWKGTADVCKAVEILQSEGVEFEFYIAFNDFETIPHHFIKPDGDENLSAFYREMDIVVAACKGQHGAIHYPVIETMAVGSSIVCTDYYPSDDNNAYKVDESSPEQIADAIKQIINNKEVAIKKREKALKDVQQFDWPIVAQKFMEYLREGCK